MTICFEKSCSFVLMCVSFVNVYQFLVLRVVALLHYVHGKHLRSCREVSEPNHTFSGQA